jgi:hypothetical protein
MMSGLTISVFASWARFSRHIKFDVVFTILSFRIENELMFLQEYLLQIEKKNAL